MLAFTMKLLGRRMNQKMKKCQTIAVDTLSQKQYTVHCFSFNVRILHCISATQVLLLYKSNDSVVCINVPCCG